MTQRIRWRTGGGGSVALILVFHAILAVAWASDPLVGTWLLEQQEVNGEKTKSEPLQLKVYQTQESLSFAFAVPVNDVYTTNMGYRVLLNGTEADVKNAKGEKVGTVKMTVAGPSQYGIVMGRANRPATTGKLTLSADGKKLTSETDTPQGDQTIHLVQVFARQ